GRARHAWPGWQVDHRRVRNRPRQPVGAASLHLRAVGADGGSGRLQEHKAPAHRPEPLARQHVFSRERGLKDLRLPLGSLLAPSAVPTHPAPDHHAPPVIAAATAASGVEALGHAVELGAPRDVFLEALLGLLGDADPLAARLLTETSDASGCGAFLLLGRRAEIGLGQRADDYDLVVFDGDLHPREPAVREPSGKPTLDRTELFLIHPLHDYTVRDGLSSNLPPR